MIANLFVLREGGIVILNTGINESVKLNETIIGALAGTIIALLQEIGHGKLHSIDTEYGTLHFKQSHLLIFVLLVKNKANSELDFSKYLLNSIERNFLDLFNPDNSQTPNWSRIPMSQFGHFHTHVYELYTSINEFFKSHSGLLNIIPFDFTLSQLNDVAKLSDQLIKNYPINTVKIIRQLDNELERELDFSEKDRLMKNLGYYVGKTLSLLKYDNKIGIEPNEILRIINEISVIKYNEKEEKFIALMCPICRAKTSDKPICSFFSGFFEGAFNNPSIIVIEEKCIALGERYCEFQIKRV